MDRTDEELSSREESKPGEIGGGRSGGTFWGRGFAPAEVTESIFATRSKGFGEKKVGGLGWPGPVDKSEGFWWAGLAQGQSIKVSD